MLLRFTRVPDSTLFWTRTGPDEFRLGALDGPWRYDDSPVARNTGIRNVRPAIWLDTEFDLVTTPQRVVYAFERGGRNMQRINDPVAELETGKLWSDR
jgi:hypothetical protein